MTLQLSFPDPMTVPQVRRLQILWRRWVRNLSLTHAQDRRLRHYYVALFSAAARQKPGFSNAWIPQR